MYRRKHCEIGCCGSSDISIKQQRNHSAGHTPATSCNQAESKDSTNPPSSEQSITTRGTSDVYCVAITPDGKQVISGSDDKTMKVWDITSGKIITTYQLDGAANSIAISRDGKTLIVGSKSGRVHKLTILQPGKTGTTKIPATPILPSSMPEENQSSSTNKPTLLIAPFTKQQAVAKQLEWAKHLGKKVIETNSIGM